MKWSEVKWWKEKFFIFGEICGREKKKEHLAKFLSTARGKYKRSGVKRGEERSGVERGEEMSGERRNEKKEQKKKWKSKKNEGKKLKTKQNKINKREFWLTCSVMIAICVCAAASCDSFSSNILLFGTSLLLTDVLIALSAVRTLLSDGGGKVIWVGVKWGTVADNWGAGVGVGMEEVEK